jgi:hypothetical protein
MRDQLIVYATALWLPILFVSLSCDSLSVQAQKMPESLLAMRRTNRLRRTASSPIIHVQDLESNDATEEDKKWIAPTASVPQHPNDAQARRARLEVFGPEPQDSFLAWNLLLQADEEMSRFLQDSTSMSMDPTTAPVSAPTIAPTMDAGSVPIAGLPLPEPGTPAPVSVNVIDPTPAPTIAPSTGLVAPPIAGLPLPEPATPAPVSVNVVGPTPAPTIAPSTELVAPPIAGLPLPDPVTPAPVSVNVVGPTPAPTIAPSTELVAPPIAGLPLPDPVTPAPVSVNVVGPTPAPTIAPSTGLVAPPIAGLPLPDPVTPAPVSVNVVGPTLTPVATTTSPTVFPTFSPSSADVDSSTCATNSVCVALNLTGFCCPTTDDIFLDCCDREPTQPEAQCENNPTCDALNLTGACCPRKDGVILACCEEFTAAPSPSSVTSAPTVSTDLGELSTPTASPILSPAPTILVPPTINRGDAIMLKCKMTETERSEALIEVLSEISERDLLVTPPNFQYMARTWLDIIDGHLVCPEHKERTQQRYVFALFYFSMTGVEWDRCRDGVSPRDVGASTCVNATRWLTEAHECTWFGVSCNDLNLATKLRLVENNLVGEIIDELFTLKHMKQISLDKNKISGVIPDSISSWSNLEILDLDNNDLTGTLPESLFNISTIVAIDLDHNNLSGSLPLSLSQLTNLIILQLDTNAFTGLAPGLALTSMPDLVQARLHDNTFTGSLEPPCLVMDTKRIDHPTYLQFFSSDCASEITCSCCSRCF